jgi:hypothetical protein
MIAAIDNPGRPSMPRQSVLGISCALIVALVIMGFLGSAGATGQAGTPVATPCAVASPRAIGGTPARVATPASGVADGAALATFGTPVTTNCLTVTLTAENSKAGSGTLTVEVLNADGTPVEDADVVILTRHIEMDHGISTTDAVASGPGTWVAERVPLGMGGSWEAQVVITQPGAEPVAVTFAIELEGPG